MGFNQVITRLKLALIRDPVIRVASEVVIELAAALCSTDSHTIAVLLNEIEGTPDVGWVIEAPISISSCCIYQPLLGALSSLEGWQAIRAVCLEQQSA